MITGHPLENIINGPAHHTLHHLYFICNYGQYFTYADRAGGSYRHPDSALDPLLEVREGDGASVEERERREREREGRGDEIAEAWEKKILGSIGKDKEE
jgi:Delta7-sterol 5-desaturase